MRFGCRGAAGGWRGDSWAGDPLCGLRCGARPCGGGAELTALCPAKLRSDSRAEFDVEVRLAAHPPHGLRSSPPAKLPPHSPPTTPLGRRVGTHRAV